MRDEFTKSLIQFFHEADKISSNYIPPTKFHEFYVINEDRWEKRIKSINDWSYPKFDDEIFKWIESVKEVEQCLDLLESIFKPRKFSRGDPNDKRPYSKEETREVNRKCNANELTRLFFRFKEKQELDVNLTIESFSKAMAGFAISDETVSQYKAQLIGFKTKNIDDVNFSRFSIRKLSEDEKLEMINKYEAFFSNLTPLNIVQGFDGAWLYDYWITGKVKKSRIGKRSTFFHVHWDKSFSEVVEELTKIIKLLRLGSGVDAGIRNFYAKSTYPDECPIYDKWYYQKYGFGNYAVSQRKSSGDTRNHLNLSLSKDFTEHHVESINNFSVSFDKYKFCNLKQIDQAIEYYTNAFDQNFGIYQFTSFMMSFESLLNGKEKKIEINKEERLKLLKEVTENINKLASRKRIKKEWSRLIPVKSITKAISIGKKIYSKDTFSQKEFNHFFDPENGCYRLRNDLLHGNFDNEIEEKIIQTLPQLSNYVWILLIKIIELRISSELQCDETNYYERLKEFAKTNSIS